MTEQQWELDEVSAIVGADSKNLREVAIALAQSLNVVRGRWIDEEGVYALLSTGHLYGLKLDRVSAIDKWNAHLAVKPPSSVSKTLKSQLGEDSSIAASPPGALVEHLACTLAIQQRQIALLATRVRSLDLAAAPEIKEALQAGSTETRALLQAMAEGNEGLDLDKASGSMDGVESLLNGWPEGLPSAPLEAVTDDLVTRWQVADQQFTDRARRVLDMKRKAGETWPAFVDIALRPLSRFGPLRARERVAALTSVEVKIGIAPPPTSSRGRFVPGGTETRRTTLSVPTEALPETGLLLTHRGQRYLVVDSWVSAKTARPEAKRLRAVLATKPKELP